MSAYQIIGFHRESKGGLTFQLLNSLIDAVNSLVRQQLSAKTGHFLFERDFSYDVKW